MKKPPPDKRHLNPGRPRIVVDPERIGTLAAHGHSYAAIAAACECSLRTVSRTLNRVRAPSRRVRSAALPLFSPSALATMLAALRLFQQEFDTAEQAVAEFPEHFDEHPPLDSQQIDALCESLNELEIP